MHSKRTSLLATVVLLAAVAGIARPAQAQGIGVGIKGGVLFPDFRTANVDLDNKTGWEAGLFFGGNRSGIIGFQIEANYMRTETEFAGVPPGGGTAKVTLDYIQVPLLARINIGTKSKNKFAVYGIAGPSVDFKVRERVEGVTTTTSDAFRDYNVSVLFGGGLEITRFVVEARYAVGLKVLNEDFQISPDVKVNSFAVLAGVRLY